MQYEIYRWVPSTGKFIGGSTTAADSNYEAVEIKRNRWPSRYKGGTILLMREVGPGARGWNGLGSTKAPFSVYRIEDPVQPAFELTQLSELPL